MRKDHDIYAMQQAGGSSVKGKEILLKPKVGSMQSRAAAAPVVVWGQPASSAIRLAAEGLSPYQVRTALVHAGVPYDLFFFFHLTIRSYPCRS
jgi:hypothetical protein